MDTLRQDLRLALRAIARSPGFTIVAALTLALGIGGATAIFSLVNAMLLRPLPFPESERLVLVWGDRPSSGHAHLPFSLPNLVDLRERARTLEKVGAWIAVTPFKASVTGAGESEKIQYAIASHELFPMLGVVPARGRLFAETDDRRGGAAGIIVSHALWRRRLPGASIDDATLTLDGTDYRVIGVLPPDFRFVTFPRSPDVWMPLGLDPSSGREYARGARALGVLARLAPGVTLEQAQREVAQIGDELAAEFPRFNREQSFRVFPLREQIVGGVRPVLILLFAATGIVLLIACANVATLLLSRGTERTREVAMRAALGAGRGRVARQLMTESLAIALLGGIGGVLLATWLVAIPSVTALAEPSMFVPWAVDAAGIPIDAPVLAFALALSVAAAVIFGTLPALHGSRLDLQRVLGPGRSDRAGSARAAGKARDGLVVAEVALAVALVVGAGLLGRSLLTMQRTETGFEPARVLAVDLDLPANMYGDGARSAAFFGELLSRVRELPTVIAAGAIQQPPLSGPVQSTDFRIIGRPEPEPGDSPVARYVAVSDDYFRAMGIRLVQGRPFTASEAGAASSSASDGVARVAIIDETLARLHWPGEDPIGRHFALSTEALRFTDQGPPTLDFPAAAREVVGVVSAVRFNGPADEPAPTAYLPMGQAPSRTMTVMVRTEDDPLQLVARVRAEVRAIDPMQPITEVATMDERVATSLSGPRLRAAMVGAFAGLAVLLAALGIAGVIAYGVSQRTREIGIRMALGADAARVVGSYVRRGVALAAIGVAAGLSIALVGARSLERFVFETPVRDPATYVLAAVATLALAGVAAWVPARRAAQVEPIEAMRGE